jgi:hypothetical protein
MIKVIKKPNGQIFEVCTSRADFGQAVKDNLWDFRNRGEGIWTDDDSSLYLKYKSGKEICLSTGDKLVPINYSQIASGLYNNPSSQIIYKVPIVFNSHYEDWEAVC